MESPIVISLDKQSKYKLTTAQDGVLFDMDGDGIPKKIAWTDPKSDVAFLALDRNGDGQITSGRELFGSHTIPGVRSGFTALRQTAMATNGGISRGSVSSDDPLFSDLLLWTDVNHNGISEPHELRRADESLAAIGLGYEPTSILDSHGNRYVYKGWAHLRTAVGRNRPKTADEDSERTIVIWDVVFTTDKK